MKMFGIISMSLISVELLLMVIVFLYVSFYEREEKDNFCVCLREFLYALFGVSFLLVPAIVYIAISL